MLERAMTSRLTAALADTPVVLLHGARQVGKTTLVRSLSKGPPAREYRTLDDGIELAAAAADPDGYVAGLKGPVVIDEVQRVPDLFRAIKASVDRDRAPGRFLLTGSANVHLLPRVSESLAGRVEVLTLWPLAQVEFERGRRNLIDDLFAGADRLEITSTGDRGEPGPTLVERLLRGGYPEPSSRSDPERRNEWYASYLSTILARDVRDLAGIEGLADMQRLMALLASRAAGLLNFADLARSLAMPQTTLKRYFALLQAVFLVHTLPAWASNRGLRVVKAPKVLLADTGLGAFLLGQSAHRLQTDGAARGALVENFVAVELHKLAGWSAPRVGLHHFRTPAGREVDLVLEDASGRLVGLEVKASATVHDADFAGLRALAEAAAERFVQGVVLYDGPHRVRFGDRMTALPIRALWAD